MPQTKDVSTSSAGTLTVPALTAPARSGGLAPALPPGATVSRGVAQTLQQLADAHNAVHGKDRKKRADLRALRVAYRRGAARKPRAGRTRRQEGLARVQAHLGALAGKELPALYAVDRVLLPGEEKRLAVLAVEGSVAEPLEHLKALGGTEPAAHTEPVPVPEQKDAPVADETKAWSDEARAAALVARRGRVKHEMPEDAVRKFGLPVGRTSDHEFQRIASAGDLKAGDLIELHEGHLHAVGGPAQHVPPLGGGPTARGHYNVPIAGHDRPARLLDNPHSGNVRQYKPNAGDLAEQAHAASYHAAMATGDERVPAHTAAEQAHLAAADAHKAAGDESAALEHLSSADHHKNVVENLAAPPSEAGHSYPDGSHVRRPDGTVGRVVGTGVNGVGVRGADGKLTVHKPNELTPAGEEERPRTGQLAASELHSGTHVTFDKPGEGGLADPQQVSGVLSHVQPHESNDSLVRLHMMDGSSHVLGRNDPVKAQEVMRGTVAARDVKPGDFVWHSGAPGGGYRVETHEVTGSGADATAHHTSVGTGAAPQEHHYHQADAQLRVVRAQ